jgi:hypothetical protein
MSAARSSFVAIGLLLRSFAKSGGDCFAAGAPTPGALDVTLAMGEDSYPVSELQLFHSIIGEGSARVRRYVMESDMKRAVRFRNVVYPEVLADLTAHGGTADQLPALWDGERLYVGAEAVIARLAAHRDVGRSS